MRIGLVAVCLSAVALTLAVVGLVLTIGAIVEDNLTLGGRALVASVGIAGLLAAAAGAGAIVRDEPRQAAFIIGLPFVGGGLFLAGSFLALGDALCEGGDRCPETPVALVAALFFGGLALVLLGAVLALRSLVRRRVRGRSNA